MKNLAATLSALFVVLILSMLLLTTATALAADGVEPAHIGRLSAIQNDVLISQDNKRHKPKINDKLFANQTLITADASKAVIKFRDGSKFAVGPNSEIKLEEFQFNPTESHTTNDINIIKGAFQFNSGYAVKFQNFILRTPSAILAVRGTAFEGIVDRELPVFLTMADGKGSVGNRAGELEIRAGQAIAFANNSVLPPDPDNIPAALTVQAIDYIQKEIGKEIADTPLT